jgi:hypothetical protein
MPEIRVGDESSAPISIHYEDVGSGQPVARIPVSAYGLLGIAPELAFRRNHYVYLYLTTLAGMRLERLVLASNPVPARPRGKSGPRHRLRTRARLGPDRVRARRVSRRRSGRASDRCR